MIQEEFEKKMDEGKIEIQEAFKELDVSKKKCLDSIAARHKELNDAIAGLNLDKDDNADETTNTKEQDAISKELDDLLASL